MKVYKMPHLLLKFFAVLMLTIMVSGCSTIDGFLGGGMNDPANLEASGDSNGDMAMPAEPAGPTMEELLAEKDQALIDQGMRIAATERQLQILAEENSALKLELGEANQAAGQQQVMLDQANESQIAAAAENASADMPRVTAPDGGYGLHLASYGLRENIEPGIEALREQIPVLINGRPIKIAEALVNGRNYYRLIFGQFDRESDARDECRQALLLISFCEVIAFEGEDF